MTEGFIGTLRKQPAKMDSTQHDGLADEISLHKCVVDLVSETYCGGDSGEDPPLPIPNREVKLTIADGTAPPGGRVGSCHFLIRHPVILDDGVFCLYGAISDCGLHRPPSRRAGPIAILLPQAARCNSPPDCMLHRSRPYPGGGKFAGCRIRK